MRCRITPPLIYALLTAQLSGCMMGPDYVRPKLAVPTEFKELKGWKQAQPKDHVLRGKWWEMFNDPRLNGLEEQVATANFSLAQAEAQYRQAEHMVLTAQSALFPVASASGTFNRFLAASGQSVAVPGVRNLFGLALSMSWQPDLWGTVRRQVEANTDTAQASAATMQALQLSLQATLAADYYQLKMLDGQKALLDGTADAYNKILTLTKNRYAVGVAAKSDVVQAEAQTESVRAQAINLGIQRAQYEHAIAVLIGKAPADLAVPAGPLTVSPPPVPLQLPSELLERRPDIAAAERKMAASNAQIGVAKAAYFPTLNLGATTGYQSTLLNTLFDSARRYWALGPAAVALSIFDGGAKNAQYKQAIDLYDANAAAYRQTVLTAFQQVEDNLAALRILEEESQVQNKAVTAANQALELTLNQYKAGTVNYLNVMTAQTVALSNRVTATQLQGARLTAAVQLVTALGGGWDNGNIPSSKNMGKDIRWTDYLSIPLVDQGK